MSTATMMLGLYLDAEAKILAGQSVRFGERTLTRADLAEVRKGRAEWERKTITESSGGASHSLARFD